MEEKRPHEHDRPHKFDKSKCTHSVKECQSLPAISAAFAAMLTEGKSVREMETLALFFNSLANDIFLIAGCRSKLRGFFFDDFDIF